MLAKKKSTKELESYAVGAPSQCDTNCLKINQIPGYHTIRRVLTISVTTTKVTTEGAHALKSTFPPKRNTDETAHTSNLIIPNIILYLKEIGVYCQAAIGLTKKWKICKVKMVQSGQEFLLSVRRTSQHSPSRNSFVIADQWLETKKFNRLNLSLIQNSEQPPATIKPGQANLYKKKQFFTRKGLKYNNNQFVKVYLNKVLKHLEFQNNKNHPALARSNKTFGYHKIYTEGHLLFGRLLHLSTIICKRGFKGI